MKCLYYVNMASVRLQLTCTVVADFVDNYWWCNITWKGCSVDYGDDDTCLFQT